MPDAVANYWGTDFPVDDPAPVALLRQQAQQLTKATQGQVEGVVKEGFDQGTAYASLYAAVPAAGDYQFKILYIGYPVKADPSNPSPIHVEDSFEEKPAELGGMPEFESYLQQLLSSDRVRSTIGRLIKYSQGRAAS